MQHQLLVSGLISLVAGKRMGALYAFGDSFSDNGNLFRIKDRLIPSPQLYDEGRFSNGPVWVEYLAQSINASLVDLAYASATTDNDVYRASLSTDASPVPGCMQQVAAFAQQVATRQIAYVPEESLVTVVFMGNDFFLPGATAEGYVGNLKLCLDQLIATTNATNILLATTNVGEIYPVLPTLPASVSTPILLKLQETPFLMRQMLQQTRAKFPAATLHDFDLGAVLHQIANRTSPYMPVVDPNFTATKACLQKAIATPDSPLVKCADPDVTMFWDDLHLTTKVHRAVAAAAAQLIQ